MLVRSLCVLAVLIAAPIWAASSPASAQSCTLSMQAMTFGSIDLTSGSPFDATSSMTVSCSGLPLSSVQVCVSLGSGSGGAGPSGSPRYMTNLSNKLSYNLFSDAARTNVWGSSSGMLLTPATMTVSLGLQGTGSASRTIYGRVLSGQGSVSPALYQSILSGTDARINFAYLSLLDCLSLVGQQATSSMTVQALVTGACSVSSTDVNFGNVSSLAQPIEAVGTLSATCTQGTPYAIGLSGGTSGATNPAQRMMSGGSGQVTYGLYRNAAHTLGWGNTAGVDAAAGVGTGAAQTYTIYGQIPAQAARQPGAYSDTIVVTLSY